MPLFNRTEAPAVTPTITAGAYTGGDVVGGLLTFDVSSPNGGGTIRQLLITDDDDVKAAGTMYIFNDVPTDRADNAAAALAIGDLQKLVAIFTIASGDYTTVNGNAFYLGEPTKGGNYKASKLYGYFVPSGTPTYAATNSLTFRLTTWAD